MAMKIKDDYFTNILLAIKDHTLYFDTDGCACGDFEIKLNEDLYLSVSRSCRKSGSTPDDKWWHIHEIRFHNQSLE